LRESLAGKFGRNARARRICKLNLYNLCIATGICGSALPLGLPEILVLAFFVPGCGRQVFNQVAYPDVKRILVKTRKERITDPKNTEGGIADPTNHAANFAHFMNCISGTIGFSCYKSLVIFFLALQTFNH